MIKLDAGNVLLKPSQRRQLMTWLKRALRLGDQVGDLAISITMQRTGHTVEIRADVANRRGTAGFRSRQHDWRDAARELVHNLTEHLHRQLIQSLAM